MSYNAWDSLSQQIILSQNGSSISVQKHGHRGPSSWNSLLVLAFQRNKMGNCTLTLALVGVVPLGCSRETQPYMGRSVLGGHRILLPVLTHPCSFLPSFRRLSTMRCVMSVRSGQPRASSHAGSAAGFFMMAAYIAWATSKETVQQR